MPDATSMPAMSSGVVSPRTRMMDLILPFWWAATASLAVKTICPTVAPGDAGRPLVSNFDLGSLLVQTGNEEVVKLVGFDAEDGFFLGDEAFLDHVNGDLDGGQTGALAVAGLEHVELAVLNGELEVLHVMVVLFHAGGDVAQLVVNLAA